jgi:hypothetical protein
MKLKRNDKESIENALSGLDFIRIEIKFIEFATNYFHILEALEFLDISNDSTVGKEDINAMRKKLQRSVTRAFTSLNR